MKHGTSAAGILRNRNEKEHEHLSSNTGKKYANDRHRQNYLAGKMKDYAKDDRDGKKARHYTPDQTKKALDVNRR